MAFFLVHVYLFVIPFPNLCNLKNVRLHPIPVLFLFFIFLLFFLCVGGGGLLKGKYEECDALSLFFNIHFHE